MSLADGARARRRRADAARRRRSRLVPLSRGIVGRHHPRNLPFWTRRRLSHRLVTNKRLFFLGTVDLLALQNSSRRSRSSLDTRRRSSASPGSLRLGPQDSTKLYHAHVLISLRPLSSRCTHSNTKRAPAIKSAGLYPNHHYLPDCRRPPIGIKESAMPSALLSYCQTHVRATGAPTRFGRRPNFAIRGRRRCSPSC